MLAILFFEPRLDLRVNGVAFCSGKGLDHALFLVKFHQSFRDFGVSGETFSYSFWLVVLPLCQWLTRNVIFALFFWWLVRVTINPTRCWMDPSETTNGCRQRAQTTNARNRMSEPRIQKTYTIRRKRATRRGFIDFWRNHTIQLRNHSTGSHHSNIGNESKKHSPNKKQNHFLTKKRSHTQTHRSAIRFTIVSVGTLRLTTISMCVTCSRAMACSSVRGKPSNSNDLPSSR